MGMARMAIEVDAKAALEAIGWFLRGKRVRGWTMLCALAEHHRDCYQGWIINTEPGRIADFVNRHAGSAVRRSIATLIFAHPDRDATDAARTVASLRAALGADAVIWSLAKGAAGAVEPDMAEPATLQRVLADLLLQSGAEWFMPIVSGDRVAPALRTIVACAVNDDAECALVYWDEDQMARGRRTSPWLKPDWDQRLFLACDGISGAGMLSRAALEGALSAMPEMAAGLDAMACAVLHAAEAARPGAIRHVPFVLTHRKSAEGFVPAHRRMELVSAHSREGWSAAPHGGSDTCLCARAPAPLSWPSVSILIPTRDQLELLRNCLDSLGKLNYAGDVEIVIMDNDSADVEALRFLDALDRGGGARVLRCPGPFNFSAINNLAVRSAKGEFVCLLNNDIEAIDGDWLTEMVRHALCPGIGAVGARLLYPDGSIQHAGVAIGLGNAAGHVQKGVTPDDPCDFRLHGVTRRVLAVTGACLVVSRANYQAVGGLDEAAFAVAFNDVDFCMKLGKAGLHNVYVAEACLTHHESKSRGSDFDPVNFVRFQRELAALQQRWHTKDYADPYLNPNFSRASERCLLSF